MRTSNSLRWLVVVAGAAMLLVVGAACGADPEVVEVVKEVVVEKEVPVEVVKEVVVEKEVVKTVEVEKEVVKEVVGEKYVVICSN